MGADLKQDTLDLIIDTINAYETRTKTRNNTLNDAEVNVLREMRNILAKHYINAPSSDFDRYAFHRYFNRAGDLVYNEMKRREALKP